MLVSSFHFLSCATNYGPMYQYVAIFFILRRIGHLQPSASVLKLDSSCTTFHVKMSLISMKMKMNLFRMNRFA